MIRWDAVEVMDGIDEVEKLLRGTVPFFQRAKERVKQISKEPQLPQYIDQYLYGLLDAIDRAQDKPAYYIEKIREKTPKKDLEKQRQQARQPRLQLVEEG